MKPKTLFKILGIAWIIFYTLWLFCGQSVFELGQSFIIFGGAYVAHTLWSKDWVVRFIFFAATNNIYDEVLGNPYAVTSQEYIIALTFLAYYYLDHKIPITTKTKCKTWLQNKLKKLKSFVMM